MGQNLIDRLELKKKKIFIVICRAYCSLIPVDLKKKKQKTAA
jgi:hypothetical protein